MPGLAGRMAVHLDVPGQDQSLRLLLAGGVAGGGIEASEAGQVLARLGEMRSVETDATRVVTEYSASPSTCSTRKRLRAARDWIRLMASRGSAGASPKTLKLKPSLNCADWALPRVTTLKSSPEAVCVWPTFLKGQPGE